MDVDDVDELKAVLDVVSDKVPALLRGLRDIMYSPESAESMADAVATFYKKLVDAGIPKEDALDMARGYMINLRDLVGEGMKFGNRKHSDHDNHGEKEEED